MRRVVDQHLIARRAIGQVAFEQFDTLHFMVETVLRVSVLVGPDEQSDGREASRSPKGSKLRCCVIEQPAELYRVIPRMPPLQDLRSPFDKPIHQLPFLRRSRIRWTAGRPATSPVIRAAQVINDRRKIDFAQFVRDDQKVIFEAEHLLDEPAKLASLMKSTAEFGKARRHFESTAEIEPRPGAHRRC